MKKINKLKRFSFFFFAVGLTLLVIFMKKEVSFEGTVIGPVPTSQLSDEEKFNADKYGYEYYFTQTKVRNGVDTIVHAKKSIRLGKEVMNKVSIVEYTSGYEIVNLR